MIPSKTNLRPGDSLSVDDAIKVVAVHSANDIAVALAEKIGGSEARFAGLMTLRAQELGMANTRFVNANGVPDPRQITTARDIAILSRAVMRDYPQYYSYFGVRSFSLRGQLFTNHNHLLREPGYDGFKTGFTNAAGYNLSASAVRNGRRLITVVLGGSSGAARDENVQTLMNAGFDVLRRRSLGEKTTIAANIAEPDDSGPIERPSVEQGDGADSGLSVELNDPSKGERRIDQLASEEQRQTIPVLAPPSARGARSAQLACSPHHRHRRALCGAPHERNAGGHLAKASPCQGRHGRTLRSCRRSEARVQTAKSIVRRHHGRRRRENA
jgi:D-alanyl-D-alanine carboxypeptidase (penicillin-binding protein 5/6)